MIMKNLLFTFALLVSFSLFGQIQTEEFKMGYKKGYQDGYLKSKGTSYNGVIDFSKVRTGIEITDFLMGDKYDDTEKKKNYERGYYLGSYKACSCICNGKIASGNFRTDSNRIKKINGNIRKYHTKIGRLKNKLAKVKNQIKKNKILRDIDSHQEMVSLIMASCNWFL